MADYTVTWVVLALYLVVLLGILVQSQVALCRKEAGGSAVEAHYLAGRQLPAAYLALTTVASVFSGYTVTGLPAEAYSIGYGYIRWIGLNIPLLVFMLALAPRMVWLAKKRGHVSVLDVVRDRFVTGPVFPGRGFDVHGSILHWLATLTFFIPSAIYLLAQFVSFTANMSILSNGAVPQWVFGFGFFLLLSTFESVGGLRAVVLTDVFQGGILIFGAVAWLVVQYVLFGGVESASAMLEQESPHLLAPPSGQGLASWFNFMLLVGGGRVVFPDILTRFTAAGNQARVRLTTLVFMGIAFIVFPSMGLIGIHGRARYGGDLSPNSVFSKVCLEVVESGWAGAIVGSLLLASSQAAIMSTADSVLMEVGKLMSIDVCQPLLQACGKPPDDRMVLGIGRLMAFVMAGLCWVLTGWETLTLSSLSNLLALQNVFTMALAPVFFASLYSDSCPTWLASLSIAFGLFFGVLLWALKVNSETLVGQPEPVLPSVVCVLNFVMVGAVLVVLRWRSSADELWEQWSKALNARDLRHKESALETGTEQSEALPRPAFSRPSESAPLREPIHQWHVLLAILVAVPLALPFGGADSAARTWGMPDWSLVFMGRMIGLALVMVYLVAFHWSEPPCRAAAESPEVSEGLAKSPAHVNAPEAK